MATKASRSNSQEAHRIMLGEKINELLNLIHLMVRCGVESEVHTVDTRVPGGKPEGQPLTNIDLPPQPPSKPEENEDRFAKKVSKGDSKVEDLKQKDKLTFGLNSFGRINFSNMSWFPNLTVPHEFKIPKFKKFSGNKDPMLHLQMYCETMTPYAENEPLWIMTFQESLSDHAVAWFLQQEEITHWKGLTDDFLAQSRFNTESTPDYLDLQRIVKESEEALVPWD